MFSVDEIAAALIPLEESFAQEVHGREAAVLIPVRVQADGAVTFIFTKRPEHMPRHAGEISFPGGRPEESDADLLATALREADEEIGIGPDAVRVIGALPPISTYVTDFAVYPVVGTVDAGLELRPHPGEVEAVLEYSLDELARVHTAQVWERGDRRFETDIFDVDGNVIWGATARILGMLLERMAHAAKEPS